LILFLRTLAFFNFFPTLRIVLTFLSAPEDPEVPAVEDAFPEDVFPEEDVAGVVVPLLVPPDVELLPHIPSILQTTSGG